MKPSQVLKALKSIIPVGKPTFLWGPPGVGKSSLVRQVADELDLQTIDVIAALLDPVDFRGIPFPEDGTTKWLPPSFLPRDGRGVIFLDELPQAPPLVQSACLQLVLDRRLGEYTLPDGWHVVAAGNRQEDRAGAHRIISPLLNRFIHLDVEVDVEDWQRWAISAGIQPEVRSFIQFRPWLLHQFDPASKEKAFATPRSWEFASHVLESVEDDLTHDILAGTVGKGPAAEFIGYLKVYKDLPDIDKILTDPDKFVPPKDPGVLYALVGALGERAKKATRNQLEAIYKIADMVPAEYGILLVRDVVLAAPMSITMPQARRWLQSHKDLLIGDMQ